MADKQLKISVEAVNNAKKTLADVESQLSGLKKTSESLSTSVFKGVASWDILKSALQGVSSFLRSSMKESIDASGMMAQVETNVRNAGFAYDELAPKIKEAGNQAVQLGFDDDQASLSLSKLLLITKDYTQAQALNNLAMDLSRSKNIDLASATQQVALVTQGNVRALKEYGIDLGDTATTADVLTEAQKKLAGSAEAFSNSTAGKLATLNEQWANMKQEIGDGISPALIEVTNIIQANMPAIIALVNGVAGAFKNVAEWIAKLNGVQLTGLTAEIEKSNKELERLTDLTAKAVEAKDWSQGAILKEASAYTKAELEVKKLTLAKQKLQDLSKSGAYGADVETLATMGATGVKAIGSSSGGLFRTDQAGSAESVKKSLEDVNKRLEEQQKIVDANKKSYDDLNTSVVNSSEVFKGIKNNTVGSTTSLDSLKSAIENAGKEYDNLASVAKDSLTDLKAEHIDASTAIKKEISDANKALKDLASTYRNDLAGALDSFNKAKEGNTKGLAESVVANQDAIAKLKESIDTGGLDPQSRIKAEEELAGRLKAEEDNATLIASLSDQISAIKQYNSMTDLERAVFDFNERQKIAQQEYDATVARLSKEYNDKKKALKQELDAIKQKQSDEQTLYESKKVYIETAQKNALQVAKDFAGANLKVTEAQIKAEIAYYNQLAEAVRNAKSGSKTKFSLVSNDIAGIQAPKTNAVTININTMIGDDQYAEKLGDKIIQNFKTISKI